MRQEIAHHEIRRHRRLAGPASSEPAPPVTPPKEPAPPLVPASDPGSSTGAGITPGDTTTSGSDPGPDVTPAAAAASRAPTTDVTRGDATTSEPDTGGGAAPNAGASGARTGGGKPTSAPWSPPPHADASNATATTTTRPDQHARINPNTRASTPTHDRLYVVLILPG